MDEIKSLSLNFEPNLEQAAHMVPFRKQWALSKVKALTFQRWTADWDVLLEAENAHILSLNFI